MRLTYKDEWSSVEVRSMIKTSKVKEPIVFDALAKVLTPTNPSTRMMPRDVRWVSPLGDGFLMQVPPGYRSIVYTNARASMVGEKKVHTIKLWVPWSLITVISTGNVPARVYAHILSGPIESLDDPIYSIPIPNVYPDGRLCLPHTNMHMASNDISGAAQLAYELVWDSRTNRDMVGMASTLAQVKSHKKPSAIWTPIRERAKKRAKKRPDLVRPGYTPLQVLHAWSRLSPEEVMAIDDWVPAGTVSDMRYHVLDQRRVNPGRQLYLRIRDSITKVQQ